MIGARVHERERIGCFSDDKSEQTSTMLLLLLLLLLLRVKTARWPHLAVAASSAGGICRGEEGAGCFWDRAAAAAAGAAVCGASVCPRHRPF